MLAQPQPPRATQFTQTTRRLTTSRTIPPPVEGWSMHFVMYAFSNHVEVLHNVTPIDLLVQSAVLSDGVVFCTPTI